MTDTITVERVRGNRWRLVVYRDNKVHSVVGSGYTYSEVAARVKAMKRSGFKVNDRKLVPCP